MIFWSMGNRVSLKEAVCRDECCQFSFHAYYFVRDGKPGVSVYVCDRYAPFRERGKKDRARERKRTKGEKEDREREERESEKEERRKNTEERRKKAGYRRQKKEE